MQLTTATIGVIFLSASVLAAEQSPLTRLRAGPFSIAVSERGQPGELEGPKGKVLPGFLNMNVDLYNFVSALNCVLAQRLVRRICPHCRREAEVSPQLLEESGLDAAAVEGVKFFEGAGCLECNGTGFLGRLAVSELLDLSDRIRELILEKRPGSEIKRAAKEEGMRFLRESALEKALQGMTTLREINRFTFVD